MFFKKIKKMFQDVAEIKAALTEESKKKVEEATIKINDISHIHLKVKKMVNTVDELGKPILIIFYEMPKTILVFDDSGEVMDNEQFKAINDLNLISMSDKIMISKKIKEKKIK